MKTMKTSVIAASLLAAAAGAAPFNAENERRVEDLLAKMTLEEKLGQLIQVGGSDEAGVPASQDLSKADVGRRFYEMIEKGAYGSLIGCRGVKHFNEAQEAAVRGRLGIRSSSATT